MPTTQCISLCCNCKPASFGLKVRTTKRTVSFLLNTFADFGLLLCKCGAEDVSVSELEDAEEEEEMLEPCCDPWMLRPCPFLFTSHYTATTRRTADETGQLRATVAKLMTKVN
jgi:hypothetical protein